MQSNTQISASPRTLLMHNRYTAAQNQLFLKIRDINYRMYPSALKRRKRRYYYHSFCSSYENTEALSTVSFIPAHLRTLNLCGAALFFWGYDNTYALISKIGMFFEYFLKYIRSCLRLTYKIANSTYDKPFYSTIFS